ncbi:membrane protein [Mycobacterium lepraemurium]|nr:PH domain-containing protein [Mycobacterium lepraemurium]ATA28301.1 membrane protein [Mycobacterium lepraemurium]
MTPPEPERWDVVVRPHRIPLLAYGAAVLIAAAHIALGLLLKVGSTGVVFRTSDRVAIAVLGLVIADVVLLFARPRLRIGLAGVSVRSLLGDKLIEWTDVVVASFPVGHRWGRIDLPDAEYIPVMAIQAVDKGRAVDAMDTVRSPLARYRPDLQG